MDQVNQHLDHKDVNLLDFPTLITAMSSDYIKIKMWIVDILPKYFVDKNSRVYSMQLPEFEMSAVRGFYSSYMDLEDDERVALI